MQLGQLISRFFAARPDSEEEFPLAEASWKATRNAVVRDSLLPISAGLSTLYFVIAISHVLLLPKFAVVPMSLLALTTALAFTALRLALRYWQMPPRWGHPVAAISAGLVLLNCFLHLYFVPEPQQTTNLLLAIVGAGFLFLSTRWLTVAILTTLAGWALLAWMAPASPNWMHFGFALYMGTILSVMVHTVRVRTLRHLEVLRQQDERRKTELETALSATEAARNVAEAVKQDLMQSEARLRLVTNQMPAVLWTTDSELRITSSLGMGLSTLDLQPQEVLEMMRFKPATTAEPEFLPVIAHRRALDGESVNYEINWKGHTFGCQIEPLYEANKKLIGTIGIAFDITARKQAEETLSKSEEQFRLTFDLAPIGMALTSLEGKILRVNQAFCKTLNYTAEELLAQAFADLTHPDDRAGYLAHRAQLLHGEISHFQSERRFVSKTGKIIYTLLQVGLVKDPQGTPLYFIGQTLDITGLKQAEEEIQQLNTKLEQRVQSRTAELRESEERYRTLYDDNPSMYFTVDAAGKILSVNSFGAEQLGYRVEELIGQPVVELFCSEDQNGAQRQMQHCLQNPKHLHTWEMRKVHRNGQMFWVRETARATWNAEGQLVIFIVCEDISSRKRLETEIGEYTEKLEQLVTERALRIQTLERQRAESEKLAATGRMAARIAHEINNPLAGIKNSFLLLKSAIPAEHPDYDYAQRIENEIARIARIVRQMFELHRPEQDSVREFLVQATIQDITAMLKAHTHERNLTVDMEIEPLELRATLSESALRQVLYNIIQNAIEASPTGGVIQIAARQQQQQMLITIADQGSGIAEGIQQRVFEPFFTTKNYQDLKTGGLGLGLSVSKSLIKAMHGTINFASVDGQGTTFRILLPLNSRLAGDFVFSAEPTTGGHLPPQTD